MRTPLLLLKLVALVWLLAPASVGAFYNPQPGRWLNRDPIEERGGAQLYALSGGDSINRLDALGLASLEYKSEGRAYYDGSMFGSDRAYGESGKQNTSQAWYWQDAQEVYGCGNGICNSRGDREEASSFVVATVKNITRCTVAVSCLCSIRWDVANWAPKKTKAVLVTGHVLGSHFSYYYPQKANPHPIHRYIQDYLAEGRDRKEVGLGFLLGPGESKELYFGYDQNSSAGALAGAGFREYMKGQCACEIAR
jgi:hypothetical protein